MALQAVPSAVLIHTGTLAQDCLKVYGACQGKVGVKGKQCDLLPMGIHNLAICNSRGWARQF